MPQMRCRDGGELLVRVLRAAGVDTVFGVISVHNMPLVEGVSTALRFVPVRHEAAAVNAADGYARVRGGLGCALTSTGTGAGNAAGSLIEALSAGSPVLHVTSQIPTAFLGQGRGFMHETKDQAGMLAAVSRRAMTITDTAQAAEMLQNAARLALTAPCGPVSVEWPIDLQYQGCTASFSSIAPTPASGAEPNGLADAAAILAQGRRPALWLGGGATGAAEPLLELADRLGSAVFTSNAGRGVIAEDHPLCVGNYATSEAGQALLDDADVLLSVGTHFRSNETAGYRLKLPSSHIQIDIDPAAISRVYQAKAAIAGDAAHAVRGILASLRTTRVDPTWPDRARQTRAHVRAAHRREIGSHATICAAIRRALPRESVIARDVTIASSSWGNRLLEIYHPHCNIFARGGGIGQGLAMGVGAAIARPSQPTVVIAGDGGLAVHLGEIATLAEQHPWLILLVFNDRGYGVLRNLQDTQGHPRAGVDLHTPEFDHLAAAFALPYHRVGREQDFEPTFRAALGNGGPILVEIDMNTLDPMPQPFTPPVAATDGGVPGADVP